MFFEPTLFLQKMASDSCDVSLPDIQGQLLPSQFHRSLSKPSAGAPP